MGIETMPLVFDLETNCKAPEPFSKASPHWPENKVVMIASRRLTDIGPEPIMNHKNYYPTPMLVGHNLKFDLGYCLKTPDIGASASLEGISVIKVWPLVEYLAKTKALVWDTQIAEYILSGQRTRYASLDDLSTKYGLPLKDDKIKAYWDHGMDTEDIPQDELWEYAQHDVTVTGEIALLQMKQALTTGQYSLILSSSYAAVALASIAHNGMHIDLNELSTQKASTEEYIRIWKTQLRIELKNLGLDGVVTNINSNDQLKKVLFGGTILKKEIVDAGFYKNGKPRTKTVMVPHKLEPLLPAGHVLEASVDEETLSDASLLPGLPISVLALINSVLRLRYHTKVLGTYLENIATHLYPDGCIHGSIDQVATATGRFNSSRPNLQNYPSSEESVVKRCFTSRFGKEGTLVEVDYKQLEVVCLAHLSKDAALIRDIKDKVDVHEAVGQRVFGSSMSKEQRRVVKTVNFGLIYGGGANTIASQSGQPVELVKSIIDAFYTRYPGVRAWQESNQSAVKVLALPSGEVTKLGRPAKYSMLPSETGRRYHFVEKDSPAWMKSGTSFSPTEIKNYPVQGLATGDIVPLMLGVLWRSIYANDELRDKCLMINTVHDSILFDIHNDVLEEAITHIRGVLKNTPGYYEEQFGVPFTLPLDVEVSVGRNWKDMGPIDTP